MFNVSKASSSPPPSPAGYARLSQRAIVDGIVTPFIHVECVCGFPGLCPPAGDPLCSSWYHAATGDPEQASSSRFGIAVVNSSAARGMPRPRIDLMDKNSSVPQLPSQPSQPRQIQSIQSKSPSTPSTKLHIHLPALLVLVVTSPMYVN